MKRFVPDYKVHLNRSNGNRHVSVGKEIVYMYAVTDGGARKFYCHYKTGRQSALYPTLRDCINNIVYGV